MHTGTAACASSTRAPNRDNRLRAHLWPGLTSVSASITPLPPPRAARTTAARRAAAVGGRGRGVRGLRAGRAAGCRRGAAGSTRGTRRASCAPRWCALLGANERARRSPGLQTEVLRAAAVGVRATGRAGACAGRVGSSEAEWLFQAGAGLPRPPRLSGVLGAADSPAWRRRRPRWRGGLPGQPFSRWCGVRKRRGRGAGQPGRPGGDRGNTN